MKISSQNDWLSVKTDDHIFSKELFANINKDISIFFEEGILFDEKGFYAKRGFGIKNFNEFTLVAIAKAFSKVMNVERDSLFLFAHDSSNGGDYFSAKMASTFRQDGIKGALTTANDPITIPQASFLVQRLKMSGGIYYGRDKNEGFHRLSLIDSSGHFVSKEVYEKAFEALKEIDPLAVEKSFKANAIIDTDILIQYNDAVNTHKLRVDDSNKLRVLVTPQYGASRMYVDPIVYKQNVSTYFTVDNTKPKEDVKYHIRNKKHLRKAQLKAIIKKCDFVFAINNFGTKLNIFYKNGLKIEEISEDHINALYITYLLSELKSKGIETSGKSIILKPDNNALTKKVIERNNLKIIDNFSKKDDLLIGIDKSMGYFFNDQYNNFSDAFVALVCLVDMLNYFKTQNQNIKTKINALIKQYE